MVLATVAVTASAGIAFTNYISGFINRYGATEASLSDEDFAAAQHLIDTKYGTEGWTHRVP